MTPLEVKISPDVCRKTRGRSVPVRLLLAAVIFCAVEALVFHTHFYSSMLEPSSSAGTLYWQLWNEQHRISSGKNQVLAVGDSQMVFRPKIANQFSGETGYTFASVATPGSTPRCWYYMIRELDPQARRYAAIIVPTDDYDDEDWEDLSSRLGDLYFLLPILRLSDLVEFSSSYPTWSERWQAFRGGLLKGWSYRRDFQDFLVNHKKRRFAIKWNRQELAQAIYNYTWTERSLKGMTVDWEARKIHFPEDQTPGERQAAENILLRGIAPQTGERATYRRRWFGRIIQHYRGSRTRVIFVRLPRGPVIRPYVVVKKSSSILEFAARGEVSLVNEHRFEELERPELFVDALHMNAPGSERFSIMLTREVARILGPTALSNR